MFKLEEGGLALFDLDFGLIGWTWRKKHYLICKVECKKVENCQ